MCETRYSRVRRLLFCSLLAAIFLLVSPARTQTVTGNITGTVTDTSGAVIPGATVTAHNMGTGVDSPTTTNGAGVYAIQFLPIGRYEVVAKADGFGQRTIPDFSLEIDQTAKFNVQLKAGGGAETVEVDAAAPILNTNDPSLGISFTANEISKVPLNGLNFSSITLYLPGAISTNGPGGMSGSNAIERNTYYSGNPSVNGNRSQANNYTLDGIDMNETENNLIGYNPAPEALQEVKVITANAPAEYGNVNGGDVVSVLKSGTNQFHGSAYYVLQNDNMNANSWSNNHATPIVPINPYTQSQFGGTLGGPILKNKLFFFGDYLGARQHTGGVDQYSVFTQAMRNGDFSALLNPPTAQDGSINTPVQLYDTQNNFTPYVNNQIPVTNPVARYLFSNPSVYPLPNATPTDGVAQNNYQGSKRSFIVNNQFDVKGEWNPRASDQITGFYGQSLAHDGNKAVLEIVFPSQNNFPTHIGGGNWVHIFSPSVVNSARVGFTRVFWTQNLSSDTEGNFGLSGNQKVGIPFGPQAYPGYSGQTIDGGPNAGGNPVYNGSIIDNTYSYIDNLTWQRGVHLFSMGVQAMRYQNNYITSNNSGFLGSFSYSGKFTSSVLPDAVNPGGSAAADFVLDRVESAQITSQGVLVGNRQWRLAGFFQDDWKVMPNLTLNLGVRYEYDQPWYEVNDKTGNIDLTNGTVMYAGRIPANAPPGAHVCSNRGCYDPDYKQIMPRLGFAWQATNRLVVRGGYGATSFFEGNAGNQRLTSIFPFVQATHVQGIDPAAATTGENATPASGGAPRTVEQGFTSDASAVNYSGSQYSAWPKNMRPAYVQEWSLTTEYALTHSTALQVGYLGEQGQHLIDYGNVNQQPVPDPTYASAPYANVGAGSAFGSVGGGGGLLITESRAMMNYNALQAAVRQHATRGLEFTVNYTYSKSMTNSLGNYGLNVSGYSGAFQNYYNSHGDYGPAGTDATHNVSGLAVYALPFGRGKVLGSGVNRFTDLLVGGWSASAAGVAYTGFPETITGPGGGLYNSYGTERANHYRKMHIVHRSLANWFGTDPSATPCQGGGQDNGVCAYGAATSATFGTASNGSERGPSFRQMDAAAFKDFHITDGQSIGFRADAFNVLNMASYTNPNTSVTDSKFGQAEGTRSNSRTLQLAVHYNF